MKCFFKESIWRNDNKEMLFSFRPSLTIAFYLRKTENRTKKFLTQLSHYGFEQKYYFWKKMLTFLQKNADISKIVRGLVLGKVNILKLHIGVYLRTKFQVSSIVLTSFRQGVGVIKLGGNQTRLINKLGG